MTRRPLKCEQNGRYGFTDARIKSVGWGGYERAWVVKSSREKDSRERGVSRECRRFGAFVGGEKRWEDKGCEEKTEDCLSVLSGDRRREQSRGRK